MGNYAGNALLAPRFGVRQKRVNCIKKEAIQANWTLGLRLECSNRRKSNLQKEIALWEKR
jgi:hypothetical protein